MKKIKPEVYSYLEQRGGVIPERNKRLYTVRLRIPGGEITPDQILGIGRAARRLGAQSVHLTTRQTIEIPHLPIEDVPRLIKAVDKVGVTLGSEHEEVVNITACPGLDRCRLSNIETGSLLSRLNKAHFGREMPMRVRIAVSACPNGCTSERLSEIGITGLREPIRDEGQCTGCGTCALTCKEKAIVMVNGRLTLDTNLCVQCGMCIDTCPFHIIKGTMPHYMITIGGRRGRHPMLGRELIRVDSEDEAVMVVERVVDWIYRYAYGGSILTDQLESMDFSSFKDRIEEEFSSKDSETAMPGS
jgi:dissimilatory sulfite reductase (desulfoviridin) alpha/beta subunit